MPHGKAGAAGDIKRNYVYHTLFQILSLLIPLITAPYIARVLQRTGVGLYSYANSIATFFSLVAPLGISSYGLREVSRARDDRRRASKLYWELSLLRMASTVLCLLVYLLFVLIFAEDIRVYLACGLVILSAGLDPSWFFQALEEFRTLMVQNFLVKLAGLICIFLFVRSADDLVLYILITAGSTLFSHVVMRLRLLPVLCWIPLRHLRFRRHLRETMLYFIPTVATSVYTVLDRAMIGFLTHDLVESGYYEQAHRVVGTLLLIITSLNVVVGVRTSYLFGQEREAEVRRHIQDTFRFMYLLAFPLAAGMLACAPDFVPWFFGPGYEQVAPLMMLSAPLLFTIGTSNVLGTLYLTPSGQRALSNRAVIAGAVLNFLLNLLLIPFLGAYGAVAASVTAELLIAVLYMRYSRRFIPVGGVLRLALRYCLLSAGMFLPVWWIGRRLVPGLWTTLLQMAVGVLLYTGELIVVRDPAWLGTRRLLRSRLAAHRTGKGDAA